MRIGIDCRLAGQAHAGIGRYIQNLIVRLPVQSPATDWVYFFHDQQQADSVLKGVRFSRPPTIVLVPVKHYSVAEQLQLPSIFGRQGLDLLHVPHFNIPLFYRGQLMVTIHDLLWHEHRGSQVTTLSWWQYWLKYWAYRWVARQAIAKARTVLVPTHTIQKTLAKYYPGSSAKTVVTKEGIDLAFLIPRSEAVLPPVQLKTLLYVGSLYPHKNLKLVIDSLPQLPSYQLVVVGARTVFLEEMRRYVHQTQAENRVEFKVNVSDQELIQLLGTAEALVQPSLSEGFGLTGLEAMAQGVPVLASQIPVFQEIYQDAAIFFDPHSVSSFVAATHKLASSQRPALIKRGSEVAAGFSWDKMVAQTLEQYQLAAHRSAASKIVSHV